MTVYSTAGKHVTEITNENIDEFKQWFWAERHPEMERGRHVRLGEDVDLSQILTGADGKKIPLSKEQQKYLASAVHRGGSRAHVQVMVDRAADYPVLLGTVNQIAGNSIGGVMYDYIQDELKKHSFAENLPAYCAILRQDGMVHHLGDGNADNLSPEGCRYLDDIFNMSEYNHENRMNRNQTSGATMFIRDALSADKLLNYGKASGEFRKLINESVFYNGSGKVQERLGKLKAEFYTPELLSEVLKKNYIPAASHIVRDTSKAKTQAEKNVNILPPYYTKVCNALLRFAEKEEIHDRNNYGQLKSLTQRYQEMCARLTGAHDYQSIPGDIKNGIMKDGYLYAAQKDIIDGNAGKLSAETLQMVLDGDRDNFYVRRIPQDIIRQKGIKLDYSKQLVSALENKDKVLDSARIDELVTRTDLTAKEKEDLIQKEESREANRRLTREFLEHEMAEYRQAVEEKRAQETETGKKHLVADSIRRIQGAYQNISKNFKDGQPNAAEAHLSAEAVERLIADRLERKYAQLSRPEQKSLPLLFGRKDETNRREWLNNAVSAFNRTLDDIMGVAGRSDGYLEEMQSLKGKILAPETKEKANLEEKESQDKNQNLGMNFYYKYKDIDHNRYQLDGLNRKTEELAKAKENIAFYKKVLKDTADERLGLKDGETLRPVTEEMSPEEKRSVRAQNKKVADKLSEKEETNKNKTDKEKVKDAVAKIRRAKYTR